jgi:serine kinase of HPr protein (carbohydrate metabolism regulator)
MTRDASPSVHASAVLVGDRAVLIRGPSGAGKSRLAFDLILAGRSGQIPRAVLVGDDRVHLDTHEKQLTVRPARELAGLIEIRGLAFDAASTRAQPSWVSWSIWRQPMRNACRHRKRC